MPHSDKHAKRLLRELDLPSNARKVLCHPSYWDPGFCRLYLDRCDEVIFHDPQAGLSLARVAPDLALLVPEGTTPEERLRHREQLVRAYATLGGAYRAVDRTQKADGPYGLALKLADTILPQARGDLYVRMTVLRADQKRFDEAIGLGEKATEIFRPLGLRNDLAAALAALGYAYVEAKRYSESLLISSEALCYSDPKVNDRVHYSATHNFAYAAVHSTDLDTISMALVKIREARRLIKHHRRSIPKIKLYWVEGILMQKLFATRRAEALFIKARLGFMKLGAAYEFTLAGLDLSGVLCDERRWDELEVLAAGTFERFCERAVDEDAIAALLLWREAVINKTLGRKLLEKIRETFITCMVQHRGAP